MKKLIVFIIFLGWINPADSFEWINPADSFRWINPADSDTCTTNPVPVGSSTTITLTVPKSDVTNGELKWKLGRFDALDCDINNNPSCPDSQLVDGLTGTMVSSGSNYRTTLTITTVDRSRDETTWEVFSGGTTIKTCDLKVYSFLSNPVCEGFGMSTDGKNVVWTCTVEDVYPEIMDCRFMYRNWDNQNHMMSITQGVDKQTSEISSSYKYTCTLNLPLNQLTGEGDYTFRFYANMVLQGNNFVDKIGDDEVLTLEFPVVQLEASCPSSYISEKDTSKTCGCRRTSPGIPAGFAQWVNEQGQPVGNGVSNDDVKMLPLIYDSNNRHPTYTCRGFSNLGQGPRVTYSPQFAYGPSVIVMTLHRGWSTVRKCDAGDSFSAYCAVAVGDAAPKPTMRLVASDGSTISLTEDETHGGYYRFKYNVVQESGGDLEMTCLASNPEFPNDMKAEEMEKIIVLVPPPSRPVMTVDGGPHVPYKGVATVTDGETVKVNCRADGGYPSVNKVTTTCAGLVNVNDGASEATQNLYVRKEDNNQKCKCKAEHDSGCYDDDESEFTLNVRYTPTMTSFEADKKSSDLTVSADDNVKFVCEVEGNPVPSVSVKGQRWEGIVTLQDAPSGSHGRKSTGTKKMTCKDTDGYTCTAHNGVGSAGTTRTIFVFVQCAPELPSGSDSSIQEYSPVNGTDKEIQIPIIGYPPPKDFSLKKITNTRRRKRATEEEEIPKHMYNTTYEAGPAPKGTVVLTLIGFTSRYSGQYVLNIDNGIGQGLDYTFNVTVVSASRPNETSSGLETSTVIGVVIAFLLGLVLTILGFFLWMKARKSRSRGAKTNEQDLSNIQARFGQHQPSPHHRHQESPLDGYDVVNAQESQQEASGRNKYWRIVLGARKSRSRGAKTNEKDLSNIQARLGQHQPSPHHLHQESPLDGYDVVNAQESQQEASGRNKFWKIVLGARKNRSRGAKTNEQDLSNIQARFGQHQPSPHHRHQESPLDGYDVVNAQESQQEASGRNKYWRIVLGGAPWKKNAATATAANSSLPPSTPHNLVSSEGGYEECDIYDEIHLEKTVEPTVLTPVNHGVYENNPSPPYCTGTAGREWDGGSKSQEDDNGYVLPQSPNSTTAEP